MIRADLREGGIHMHHTRIIAVLSLFLCLILVTSGCRDAVPEEAGSEQSFSPPAETAGEDLTSETVSPEPGSGRLTPEGTLLPPEGWDGGELYPYPVVFPYRFEGQTPESTQEGFYLLYGLADEAGNIVTDPYFADFSIISADDGSRFLILTHYTESYLAWLKTELFGLTSMLPPQTETMILEKSGRWASSFGSSAAYLGENRLLLRKGTLWEIYKTDGSLLLPAWQLPSSALLKAEIPYGFWYPSDVETVYSSGLLPVCGLVPEGGGEYLFNYIDPEGNLLLSENCPAVSAFDPYGMAAVKDPETGLFGVIDTSGQYLLKPTHKERLNAVTRDLYSFTEDEIHFGLLRVSTGGEVFPAKFWDIPVQPEDPNGIVWLSPETNYYPWSVETGKRVPLPSPLSELPGSSTKTCFHHLAGDWYYFLHGYGTPSRVPEYILFRYTDPASYLSYPADSYYAPEFDEIHGKIVLMRKEDLGYVAHALFLDPVTGEESEPERYYYPVLDMGDGLYKSPEHTSEEEFVYVFTDADGNRFFEEEFLSAKSSGGGLFACAGKEGSCLCRRDGTKILSLLPAETAVRKAT